MHVLRTLPCVCRNGDSITEKTCLGALENLRLWCKRETYINYYKIMQEGMKWMFPQGLGEHHRGNADLYQLWQALYSSSWNTKSCGIWWIYDKSMDRWKDAKMDGRVKNILLEKKSIHLWTENYKGIHERDTSRWMSWYREIKEIWYVQGTDSSLVWWRRMFSKMTENEIEMLKETRTWKAFHTSSKNVVLVSNKKMQKILSKNWHDLICQVWTELQRSKVFESCSHRMVDITTLEFRLIKYTLSPFLIA